MIRSVRTWQVPESKTIDAQQLVKEINEYDRTHPPERFPNSQMFWQRFDPGTTTFYLMRDHEDLAAMERDLKDRPPPDETMQAFFGR